MCARATAVRYFDRSSGCRAGALAGPQPSSTRMGAARIMVWLLDTG